MRVKKNKNKDTVMFLLMMDTKNFLWNIPEETLWATFDEAFCAAMDALMASECRHLDICGMDFVLGESAFVPECFEIMPIALSTADRITWYGKERKQNENEDA